MSNPTIIAKEFVIKRQPMISGQAEAQERSFRIAMDEQGCVWMYSLEDKDPGGHVYFHDPKRNDSDGFGGATLIFTIGKFGKYHAKGAWHANSESLYDATKIDLRDKHLTFGVIALGRKQGEHYETILTDVLEMDKEPKLGPFSRTEKRAQELANELGQPVIYYSESGGGSSNGPVYPKGWDRAREMQYWKEKQEADERIQPTKKSDEIEQVLTELSGADRRQVIAAARCMPAPIGCGGLASTFRDSLSRKEYAISGLCQKCQDSIFEENADAS